MSSRKSSMKSSKRRLQSDSEASLGSISSENDDPADLAPLYNELKNEGLNSVDGIINTLRKAQIIDSSEKSELMVRKMFLRTPNHNDIPYEHFKVVVTKLATKIELLKIAWRLRKAERQLKKAEKEMNSAVKNTSRIMSQSLAENRALKNSYSRSNKNQLIDNTENSELMVRKTLPSTPYHDDIHNEHFVVMVIKLATKLKLLKILWRLRKAERQLKRAKKEMDKAVKNTSRTMGRSLAENRAIKY